MAELNSTPNANRLHIGIFGRTNSGKSTLVNILTGQSTSIVSDVAGTTTDIVYKAMEISPLGPCVLMDTAGLEDTTALGAKRLEKTKLAMDKADIAIVVFPADGREDFAAELDLLEAFRQKDIPVLCLVNVFAGHADAADGIGAKLGGRQKDSKVETVVMDCGRTKDKEGLRMALSRLMPEDYDAEFITGSLVSEDDVVLLVMPQDIQAPKRRLILPQVQTIRELLDRKCTVICASAEKFELALSRLKAAPQLIITDSQVFRHVYEHKPSESRLTSFSVLFAAYKGDLSYYIEGARHIDSLTENSRVLIAECCTHAPLKEDIGREKIPRLLRKRFGEGMQIDVVSGTDFPDQLSGYDLIIQCGGCMFNRQFVMARIQKARESHVPMTNYGVAIAHLTGILDKISY
ncbi:[FeFe] hydrogenase H-cluster maturation GTPase HydF [Anaerovibrio sp.]|uniref:[FeFe] hydrogenase H-cluster maturation GTPase HydF n=1 Tax=Anaerovibrio sp. TaxID=1872532 RepID=UPI003F1382F6